MVNVWLRHDDATSKRRLNIQTYKIVPLSQQAGVLQWCENTVPLGQWLVVDGQSAHARYRPQVNGRVEEEEEEKKRQGKEKKARKGKEKKQC